MEALVLAIIITVILFILGMVLESTKTSKMSDDEKKNYYNELTWGPLNPAMICPHCQKKGLVRIKAVEQKKGISGAKATGALLTGGVSLLATGLSRKEVLTQAHCGNCNSTWNF